MKRPGISKRQRFRVLQRCGFRCCYCGRPAGEVVLEGAREIGDVIWMHQ